MIVYVLHVTPTEPGEYTVEVVISAIRMKSKRLRDST